MFLPVTKNEMKALNWDKCDVILISGDTYIDSPYIGISVIGHLLSNAGYRVGIIAQPKLDNPADITSLGEPALFWGISGGSVDSMVTNYTASLKPRRQDDYTPGGLNNRRPDRAVIQYSNLIRKYFKNTVPIVLGGIEASLRRIAHYDYWSDKIRRSILFDAKADYLVYGMAEKSIVDLANSFKNKQSPENLRGIAFISKQPNENYINLPSFEDAATDHKAFIEMYHHFYKNTDPKSAKGLNQKHGDRYLVQNPPAHLLTQKEMDFVYSLPFERDVHPHYKKFGEVRALQTIQFSIKTHHGCYGECNFCAIAVHEGRTIQWRSEESILEEAKQLAQNPDFKGYIADVGGPTANMYGFECSKKLSKGVCEHKRCIFPEICSTLKVNHSPQTSMLKKIRQIPGIKKAFVASGIRYDMILDDKKNGEGYLKEIVAHHVSGQMKIAPEHSEDAVLEKMGKPGKGDLIEFKKMFDNLNEQSGKKQFLTYYLIAAHPGCTEKEMMDLKDFTGNNLRINPEQVQIFTPTPGTYSSVMYHTETDPFSDEHIFVEKSLAGKMRQKYILTGEPAKSFKKNVNRSKSKGKKQKIEGKTPGHRK